MHKLKRIVEKNNGVVLDVNTDAVSCTFENNVFPFELQGINLNCYYWDNECNIPKYKIEYKGRLTCSRLANVKRVDQYIDNACYEWNVLADVEDNDFTPLVEKILDSNESFFIDGPGGVGKSTLVNMIKSKLREVEVDEEEEELEHKQDSVDTMRIKQQSEAIKKKLQATTERLNTKLSKTRRQEAEDRIKKLTAELEELQKKLGEQKTIEKEADNVKSYVGLAPTNIAALIINGTTIHKFSCLIRS